MAEVLIVAPPSRNADRLRDILQEAGHGVHRAESIAEGLLAADRPVLAAFCFYALPDGTILNFLEQLRGRSTRRPVVIVADFAESCLAAQAMQRGAADFLPVPLDPAEVSAAIGRILAQRSANPVGQIRFEADEGVLILHLPLEVTYDSARSVDQLIQGGLPNPASGIIVNLERTRYFSSSGISSLFLLHLHFPALKERVFITGANPQILHTLRLAGTQHFFRFAPTVGEAVKTLAAEPLQNAGS